MTLWLQKIPDNQQAQTLLNYFSQCLLKQSIRNPLSYFITLVKRFIKGVLVLSDQDKKTTQHSEKQRKSAQIKREKQHAYNAAWCDHENIKAFLTDAAKQKNCSFEAYVEQSPYKALWQSVITKLKTLENENKKTTVANE
jgi:hypothetical protein